VSSTAIWESASPAFDSSCSTILRTQQQDAAIIYYHDGWCRTEEFITDTTVLVLVDEGSSQKQKFVAGRWTAASTRNSVLPWLSLCASIRFLHLPRCCCCCCCDMKRPDMTGSDSDIEWRFWSTLSYAHKHADPRTKDCPSGHSPCPSPCPCEKSHSSTDVSDMGYTNLRSNSTPK